MIRRTEAHGKRYLKSALFTLAAIAISDAHAVKLYKWVDENGSTHYHQTPPPVGTPFVEEKEFDGKLNVIPSPASEAASEETPSASPQSETAGTPDEEKENGDVKPLTPEEVTAIAEEGTPQPEPLIELPSVGAEPGSGSGTAAGASGASSGAGSTSAGTATGAAPAVTPAPLPPPPVAVPLGGP